jgi:thiosulfate/3-mercaptopyruvate sulfurtransferase
VRHDDLYAASRPTLTAQQCGAGIATLLDARAPERFRGDVEPVDPVAGHIPGARNLPSGALLTEDGAFVGNDALAQLLSGVGIDPSIDPDGPLAVYCGSGVTATITIAALAAMGREAALFPGSWSEWSSDPSRAVGRGPE